MQSKCLVVKIKKEYLKFRSAFDSIFKFTNNGTWNIYILTEINTVNKNGFHFCNVHNWDLFKSYEIMIKFPWKWGYKGNTLHSREAYHICCFVDSKWNEMKNRYNNCVNRNLCWASAIQLIVLKILPEVLLSRNFKRLSWLRMFLYSSC